MSGWFCDCERPLAASSNATQAISILTAVLASARNAGFIEYQTEAQLAIGEVTFKSTHSSAARTKLENLAAEADAKGFHRLADRGQSRGEKLAPHLRDQLFWSQILCRLRASGQFNRQERVSETACKRFEDYQYRARILFSGKRWIIQCHRRRRTGVNISEAYGKHS